MGLSSFWTAIKRPRFSDSSESRKPVDRVHDHHHKTAPVDVPREEAPHHFDAIYDTHHHILPTQSKGHKRHPSSPPRIHSPNTTKQHKKPSLWKSASTRVKSSQQSDGLKHENSMKRRSFWRSSSQVISAAPAVQHPALRQTNDERNATHRPRDESDRLLPTNNSCTTDIKTKRSSLRLNLRRSVSSQSSKRNSLRFSFLANGAGDSDDEDIPAVPAIPANIQRHKSAPRDGGRHLSMIQPGTAVTSDEVHHTSTQPKSRTSLKRQSLSKLITGRKSMSDIAIEEDKTGNKRKHRSWFSVHGSQSSNESPIPPMPALPNAAGGPVHPSEAAFHAFLHNIHNAAPKGANTTDYERFLRASRAFDASIPTPPRGNSFSEMHAPHPRPISSAPTTALPEFKQRSSRRASRCRPQKADNDSSTSTASPTSPSMLSNEQQREWNKLRQLMDGQPSGSDNSEDGQDDDDDGVMGMLRQLSRDEDREYSNAVRDARRRRDREKYLGIGAFENKDALAALEAGGRR